MSDRKMITKEIGLFNPDFCTLQQVLLEIQKLIERFGQDAFFQEKYSNEKYDTYFAIMKNIPETDIEMNVRIAMESKHATQALEREQAEFKRLSEKFKRLSEKFNQN